MRSQGTSHLGQASQYPSMGGLGTISRWRQSIEKRRYQHCSKTRSSTPFLDTQSDLRLGEKQTGCPWAFQESSEALCSCSLGMRMCSELWARPRCRASSGSTVR